jgi:filamentous hemagglutinin
MNQGIYKLVYSKVLNMYVPASEAVRSHRVKSGRRVRRHAKNSLVFTIIASFIYAGNVLAGPAGLIPGTQAWVNATITSATNNSLTITQSAPKAILDWQKLNLNAGELLKYNQQGNRTWSALNRIHDLNPSILNGNVQADGNVYFINTNGIIFGQNAQFNVGSIYAGTLDITNDLFNSGFIKSDGSYTNVFGDGIQGLGGFVTVEKGAQINAASGGKVLLFAPTVTNNGIINTPDGQTILAAGNKVYLASSKDPAGFLVEVDSGGTATNLGKIVAERGNITMMGLAVNQAGTLTATTSVRANGSIRLLAQDSVSGSPTSGFVVGARNGNVTLVQGSVTEVNPEYANKEETIASQPFTTSDITIEAGLVNIDGTVSAKGGNVTVNAANPASAQLDSINPNHNSSRIYLGDNATIDVSGVDAIAPMSRNQLVIQLFSDQLKDAPILRDGGLFKQTVYVDARKGTQLLDIQPFLDLKGATVAEKMTKAGTVTLSTPDTVIAEKGSVINVSGGSTTFEAGAIKETNLYYNGKLVPISEAKPGVPYDKTADVYSVTDSKWGVTRSWDLSGGGTQGWGKVTTGSTIDQLKTTIVGTQFASYFEGDDAGTLTIINPNNGNVKNVVLAGQLLANTKVSIQQLINQTIPLGGELIASATQLEILKNAQGGFAFEQALQNDFQSVIDTDFLAQGFNRIDFSDTPNLAVNDAMYLMPNGSLKLGSNGNNTTTQINADIIAPGSQIALGSLHTTLADGVKISTAGTFTNDKEGVTGQFFEPTAVNGGGISANILNLGKNVTVDASAGAWVDSKGKLNQGNAGDIKFTTTSKIDDSVTLQSYGFKQGGTLDVSFGFAGQERTLNIAGNPAASAADIDIASSFFNKGGFSKYSLSAQDVNIGNGTSAPQEIYAAAQTWQMNAGFANQTSGQPMSLVASPFVQPDTTRKPVSLSFAAKNTNPILVDGVLTLAENTTIRTDRGGNVSLAAGKQVNVLGDISTPSGTIDIKINDNDVTGTGLPYDSTQAIFIGEKANLSATGSSLTLPDSQPNLLKTQVFNAGTITVDAPKGALIIKDGAVLDVSGTSVVSDTKTVTGFMRETLNGDAGTIKLSASDGLLLDGTFKGAATGTGRGGTLDLGFTNATLVGPGPFLTGSREFNFTQQKQLVAQNFALGDALKTATGNVYTAASTDAITAQISANQVQQGGFANLNVHSSLGAIGLNNSIQLANGVDLKLAGNLKLETQLINVKNDGLVKLSASTITFKRPVVSTDNASIATGNGQLETQSKQFYFDGLMAVAGVNKTSINTTLDINGTNGSSGNNSGGGLITNGDIIFTARQIYPSTNSKLNFEAIGDNSTITVNSNGVATMPVYSAAGILSLKAANVVQNGVLTAPFGQIDIDATKSATFVDGSITSVSANNLIIPFGGTAKGGQVFGSGTSSTLPPDKSISIKSANVDLQKNAVVDLSAGGDMQGVEWVPGTGGSQDISQQPNMYAVIANFGQNYAPVDVGQNNANQLVGVGQSVYLTGVPGLASGYYTLLPARYALLPGAFMVEANMAGSALLPTQIAPQLDGSTLTTGYLADLGTGARDANWSTFKVTDGAIFHPAPDTISKAPSQYILTSVNEFFSDLVKTNGQAVSLPRDVARLSLDATKLNLEGTIDANKQVGGKGLQVDISSNNIRVVNANGADDGSLQLTAASLNALNADSLLLGGNRTLQNGVVQVNTTANSVSIENNSSSVVKTPELIVSATDNVTVKAGAVVDTGAASKTPATKVIATNGDGALLALSSTSDIDYSRTGSSAASTKGKLNIEAGSTLKAGNSVVLDATNSASLLGTVSLQDGGSATFGANRILIGNAPTGTSGLNANATVLAALGQLKSLTLNSYNNIDTFGQVNFGNSKLDLTMNASGIVGHLANDEVGVPANATPSAITANTFTLKNTQNADFIAPTDPSGRGLEINASAVKFSGKDAADSAGNSGKMQVAGFTNVDIKADEVRVAQTGGLNLNVAKATITTGRITGETGAYQKDTAGTLVKDTTTNFEIDGKDISIAKLANAKLSNQNGFGAKLIVAANDLTVGSNIDLSSGELGLTATNNLNIVNGANIGATSTANTFNNQVEQAPAGSVTLTSITGNVNVDAGAVVDVTGQGEANAGLLKVVATSGTANINGDLKGTATGTGKGGVLDVDVKTLADLSVTNSKAAGFSEERQYRVRTGDVAIIGTGTNALSARETIVSADAGKITVTGDIIATAPNNNYIGLFANNGVTLENAANLKANSSKVGGEGGKVEVYTQTGNLDLKTGSIIDVSGGTGGAGGDVHLRAPRTGAGTGNGVAVTNFAINISGAKSTILEAFKIFTGTTSINAGSGTGAALGFDTVANDVNSFMVNKNTIVASLGKTGDDTFHLRAGIEVDSAASLTVGTTVNDWNLYSATRAGDEPSVLTLRAKDNITFNGTLSDGFTTAATTAGIGIGDSTAYRIAAGADFTAANPLATIASAKDPSGNALTGNVSLANNKIIRTGAGDIDIAAGGDLKMLGANSAIYTAGINAAPLTGFDLPANTLKPLYLTDGGDISINTKGNIVGGEPTTGRQLVNEWLFREGGGTSNLDTTWWVRPDLFKQSLATLGGGDISINAGGNISNFSASAPTSARFDTNGTTGNQSIDGGGDVTVKAGGDINNGVYFVAKGEGEIDAGGSIQKQNTFGTTLALQDGKFNVSAGKNAYIETTINPTLVSQSLTNSSNTTDTTGKNSYFNSYSSEAAVNISSLIGNTEFGGNNIKLVNGGNVVALDSGVTGSVNYNPSNLKAVSYNGDTAIGDMTLLPSATGNLNVLANNNVNLGNILMSDADPAALPSNNIPTSKSSGFSTNISNKLNSHANPLLHKNDAEPILVVAQNGDITGAFAKTVTLPKASTFVAGHDIRDLNLVSQNNNSSDITLLKAGNDIKVGNVYVSGPGELLVQAGHNIDLTNTAADIASTGNFGLSNSTGNTLQSNNPALPTDGASITLQAGLGKGANVRGYIDQYILPTGAGPSVLAGDAAKLAEYRATTAQAVTDYMRKTTGNSALTDTDALAQFNALSLEAKTIFVNRHLTSELIASAQGFATAGNHDRGNSAIATLFPTLNSGDILLYASKVSTNSGGSIDLIAPGGLINVGAPGKQFKDDATQAGAIGVITEKGGAIRAIANGDFQVNQSKLITQFGSDIAIWSTTGTIDAGRGSKTATSIPERIVQTDADGNTIVEVRGVAAGSGIRAQTYDPDGPNGPQIAPKKGSVFLTAPRVDAGEAGIEAGDLLIVAPIVLNAANIQVSGTSSGVPVTATSNLAGVSAGLSPDSVNSATAAVAQSVAQSANQQFVKPILPSIISVDVISIGN